MYMLKKEDHMKKFFAIALIALLAFSLFANGTSEKPAAESTADDGSETLELVLMTKDSTNGAFQNWLKTVEEACNLKITVIATPTNSGDRQAKITTVLSTGDKTVDIITINDEMYSAFKNTGWMEKLNDVMTPELIKEYPTAYLNDMVITKEGNIYSVPMYFSALGWFVNTDIMKECGIEAVKTWDDFQKLAKAATNADRFGYGDAWDPTYIYNSLGSFVNLYGGDYFNWNDPKTQAGLHALVQLLKDGYTTTGQMADQYEQLYQNMVAGKRAICLLYTGQIAKFKKNNLYAPEGPIVMITPPVADPQVGATAYCSSWHYILNAASPNKKAARRFLNYAASKQGQLDYTKAFGTYPAYLSLLNSAELDNLTGIDQMREYVEKVTLRGRPIAPEAMEYISEIGNLFHKLALDQIDEKTFCKQAQESTDKFF